MEKILPIPINEKERLQQLLDYKILDTLPEKEYDNITRLASNICGTEIALISLVDNERQWFKSKVGLDADYTSREISFCQYAIMDENIFEVNDASTDPTFKDNPLVTGDPNIRHYAGVPLKSPQGHNIGTLCVIDSSPGNLTENQKESLEALGNQVISLLELRLKTRILLHAKTQNDRFFDLSLDMLCVASIDGYFKKLSPVFETVLGYKEEDLLSQPFADFIHPDDLESTFKEVEKLSKGATTIDFLNRYRKKNGDYRWFSWRAAPDTDSGLLYAMARDVTDTLMQQRNNKAELEAINNSVIRMEMTAEGNIINVNERLKELLEYDEEELIGTHHNLLVFEEDKYSASYELFWEALRNGTPQQKEFKRKSKTGKEIWIRGSYIPVIDFEGKIAKIIKIAYDITEKNEAEGLLIEERQRLDNVIRGTNLGTWEWNVETGETIFNERWAEIIGYTLQEISPVSIDTWMKYAHPDDLVKSGEALEKHFKGETEFYSFESRMKHKNGRWVWVYDRGKVVSWTEDGKPLWMYGTHQEITDKKEAEEQLAMLSLVAEKTENAVIITDKNRKIEWVNKAYENISGYNLNECKGHNPGELLQGPNTDLKVVQELRQKLDNGEPFFGEILNYHKSGTPYWLELSVTPIFDSENNLTRFIAIESDITERKNKEYRIEELVSTQEAILNGTEHAIVFTDNNGIVKKMNSGAEQLLGYRSEEMVNIQSPAIWHEHDEVLERNAVLSKELNKELKPGFDTFVVLAREYRIADVNEWTYITKSGKRFPALLSVTCIRDQNDEILGYLGVATDISIQKQQFNEIQRKNKELDQFSYIVSHDLKAPLRGIASLATFLEEDLEDKLNEETQKYFDLLKQRVKSLEYLVNDILDYSKIGRSSIEKQNVNLYDLIKEIAEGMEIPTTFQLHIDKQLPTLLVQRVFMFQVFSNLISNAIKYIDKENGVIEVKYEESPEELTFMVKDNGPGIDPMFHEKVFQIFQTIEKRDKPDSTGIGLSTVNKIIEELDGRIELESELGSGACFKVILNNTYLSD